MSNILYELETTKRGAYKRLREDEKGKRIPIISDVMFKTMINNESRKKYLSLLVSEVLNLDYYKVLENIRLIKNTLDKDNVTEAGREVDCLCELNDTLINIEVNDIPDKTRLNRNEDYIRSIFSQRKVGDDYNYKEVVQINIDNFSFVGVSDTVHRYENKETLLGRDIIMSKNFQTYHIYLPKIREKFYNKDKLNKLELLMVVFNEKEDSDYLSNLIKGEKIMEEYIDEAKILSMDDDLWFAYETARINKKYKEQKEWELKHYALKEGEEKGIKEGMKEGKKVSQQEIAKNMLKDNVQIENIIKYTGLTEEEINKLK